MSPCAFVYYIVCTQKHIRQVLYFCVCVCVLAGTGSVLKIQELLHICSESFKPEDVEEGGKEGGEGEGAGKPADTDGKAGGKAKDAKDKNDGMVNLSRDPILYGGVLLMCRCER